MNVLDKIESNISDNVVDKKLDPLDDIDPNKKMDRETGHRVANALNAMKESLSLDSSHKTGSALNSTHTPTSQNREMSFMDRIEDKMSNAYVDAKLDPTEKPHHTAEHHAEEHATGEHYHGGSRLSDAFISLSNAIHGDTHHKTGEAFNEDDDDDKMRKMSSDGKEW